MGIKGGSLSQQGVTGPWLTDNNIKKACERMSLTPLVGGKG
jgi:hypothetical protein